MSAPGTAVPDSTVDQIVFRWQGNLGRRGSGIAAAAWSCPPERADELARELAPLLRVDGALRPSLVRTVTKRGEAAVIRRWPTADPGGRPNTACHLLLGPQEVLGARLSLALRDWSFGTKRFAEEATDRCPPVSRALLRDSAEQTWADTPARIAGVTDALTVATAALLRRPRHRLSLRSDALPGWPERNPSAAVISGLHEIFGHTWLQQPWTFATYDVTDRHDLLVTWVADWATDSGQQQPRSRVDPRRPEADRAHELAARLVERCLETTDRRAAGLPELTGELRDAANWPAEERLRRLARTLGIRAADPRPKHTRPDPDPDPTPDPDPFPVPDPTPLPVPVPAPFPVPDPGPFPVPDPVPDPTPDLDDQPVYAPPERLAPPALPPPRNCAGPCSGPVRPTTCCPTCYGWPTASATGACSTSCARRTCPTRPPAACCSSSTAAAPSGTRRTNTASARRSWTSGSTSTAPTGTGPTRRPSPPPNSPAAPPGCSSGPSPRTSATGATHPPSTPC